MSSKSLLQVTGISISSPGIGTVLRTPISASSPRSILKRPPPLALSPSSVRPKLLSPLPFATNISVVVSPSINSPSNHKSHNRKNLTVSITSPGSPHVHFPPSAHLTSTFVAHSSECYDRSAIKVSPNPLEIPSWGTRVYSPTTGSFREAEKEREEGISDDEDDGLNGRRFGPPKRSPFTPTILLTSSLGVTSPISQTFKHVPFSPRPTRTRASIRFQNMTALNSLDSLPPLSGDGQTGRSLKSFPRSPYPIGPISPIPNTDESDHETEIHIEDLMTLSPLPSAPVTVLSPLSTPRSRAWFMSPSPKDPFAGFPSISLVLSQAENSPSQQ